MLESARANLELQQYVERDVSAAQARRLFDRGKEQIARSLEPFGCLQPAASKTGWNGPSPVNFTRSSTCKVGDPVLIQASSIEVAPEATALAPVKQAVDDIPTQARRATGSRPVRAQQRPDLDGARQRRFPQARNWCVIKCQSFAVRTRRISILRGMWAALSARRAALLEGAVSGFVPAEIQAVERRRLLLGEQVADLATGAGRCGLFHIGGGHARPGARHEWRSAHRRDVDSREAHGVHGERLFRYRLGPRHQARRAATLDQPVRPQAQRRRSSIRAWRRRSPSGIRFPNPARARAYYTFGAGYRRRRTPTPADRAWRGSRLLRSPSAGEDTRARLACST